MKRMFMVNFVLITLCIISGCGDVKEKVSDITDNKIDKIYDMGNSEPDKYRLSGSGSEDVDKFWISEVLRFQSQPKSSGKITLLGDSITYFLDKYDVFSQYPDVRNRAIGSQTTIGIINYLDFVASEKPRIVFLLIGSNDIDCLDSIGIAGRIKSIVNILNYKSPTTKVIVVSMLPTWGSVAIQRPNYIMDRVNNSLAVMFGNDFYNINPLFKNGNEADHSLFIDGIHPSKLGAEKIRDLYISKINEIEG